MIMETKQISYKEAIRFLLPRHYSGRKPQVKYAFGYFVDNALLAVCTIGKPASPHLCSGICGEAWSKSVYELNRVCRVDDMRMPLSGFIGDVLRQLKSENLILVSYSDTGMKHNGYLYQACNFIYTGMTKQRTDKYTVGNKHSRHYKNNNNKLRKIRTAKHRYVYFCAKKSIKKKMIKSLNYNIEKYPKGQNENYILGQFQKPIVVNNSKIPNNLI